MFTETADVRIEGLVPCLMHNGRLANPLDPMTKEIKRYTSKGKKKTDADHSEIARLEFLASLYLDEEGAPCWPGENIEAMIKAAAKASRAGPHVDKGIICLGPSPDRANWPLLYDGPKTAEGLWADPKFRSIQGARVSRKATVMRCRPIFRVWALEFQLLWDPSQLNEEDLVVWLHVAGSDVGLSDWRPKFGRFEVKWIRFGKRPLK